MTDTDRVEAGPVDTRKSGWAKLRTLPAGSVRITGGVLADRQRVNREVSLPHGKQKLEEAGNFHDLTLAAGRIDGEHKGPVFIDSDLYKWVEALGWQLAGCESAELLAMLEETAELIQAAQAPDGYLNTWYQMKRSREDRWANLRDDHELYCAGHLFQAAIAQYRVTGDQTLLNVSLRFGELIERTFGPSKRDGVPGHPEIEMALVELYRVTGEKRYLQLAEFFVDRRGAGLCRRERDDGSYHQDRVAVREADRLEGHAVRQLYLLCGAADIYLETGDEGLWGTCERLWRDLVDRKMYVTGGAGARYQGEAFGEAYELPSQRAYSETCAAIAGLMWAWRMQLATGQAMYADVVERALFNGVLSGVGMDGKSWFYVNPLASGGGYQRSAWYGCACCPPNAMRLLATLGHYVATGDEQGVQIHQYTTCEIASAASGATMKMQTAYPWHGGVQIEMAEVSKKTRTLSMRVPDWCRRATVSVNGYVIDPVIDSDGYVTIHRRWEGGDVVELTLPMPIQLLEADPRVESVAGCVAVQRGPIVYCAEQCDQAEDVDVMALAVDAAEAMEAQWSDEVCGGAMMIAGRGVAIEGQGLYRLMRTARGREVDIKLAPYHLWANREVGPMRVWLPRR